MRTSLALALTAACAACAACNSTEPGSASPPWQQIDLQVGARSFDGFDPIEDQTAFGLEYVAERPGDDFGVALGVSYSGEQGSEGGEDVEVEVFDASLGLRRSFDVSQIARPYVGLGLSLLAADSSRETPAGSTSDEDIATAFHLRAGALFDITERFHLGFDARWVFSAGLDLDTIKGDGDSAQLAFVVGYSF
jgi:opacity protein-like surface antigen